MHDSFELVGTTIADKYRVQEVVGEGGFGLVYRGHHLGFDHPIAVKCLKVPAHFTGEARRLFIERFREEGKLLFRLSEHRSIVRVFDHSVLEVHGQQVPYLVLEWLDGISLHDHLEDRRRKRLPAMSEIEALQMLRDPIDGLAFAHQLRVAHRDIKPENLFLARTSTGTVTKLLDFGVAKLMEEADIATQYATATSSGFRAFSPQYGAPEQFFSKTFGQTGPWTDVHAMGLLLTELVSSRPAFDGTEFGEFYTRALAADRPTPRARGATVTPELEALCASALARESRNRFRSASELLEAVDVILESAAASERRTPIPTGRRRWLVPWSAGAVVAVLGVATAAVAWPPSPPVPIDPSHGSKPVENQATAGGPPLQPSATPLDAGTASQQGQNQPGIGAAGPPDAAAGHTDSGADNRVVDSREVAPDGTVFRVGDTVFLRRGAASFEKVQLKALAHGKAVVDATDVSIDDISPAELPTPGWTGGAMVLVASHSGSKAYLGKVTAVQGKTLTLRYWDGRRLQSVRFADSESSTGDLAVPVRVRDAWQKSLARTFEGFPPQHVANVSPKKQPDHPDHTDQPVHPNPPPPSWCENHCINGAGHEKGTPGYLDCLKGCQ